MGECKRGDCNAFPGDNRCCFVCEMECKCGNYDTVDFAIDCEYYKLSSDIMGAVEVLKRHCENHPDCGDCQLYKDGNCRLKGDIPKRWRL